MAKTSPKNIEDDFHETTNSKPDFGPSTDFRLGPSRQAAARGHHVTVLGRTPEVGGKARLHAQLPGGAPISTIHTYQYAAAKKAGVQFKLGVTASVDDVLALKPDAVVLATGSRMLPPPWLDDATQRFARGVATVVA